MGKVLAIDYGSKRVGLAITDSLKLIASGLATVHSKDVVAYIKNLVETDDIECIVIGEAKDLRNNLAQSAKVIEPFVRHIAKKFPTIKITRVDERFTSKMAFQTMIDAGLSKKKRRDKALVDEISAVIILQSYLEQHK